MIINHLERLNSGNNTDQIWLESIKTKIDNSRDLNCQTLVA